MSAHSLGHEVIRSMTLEQPANLNRLICECPPLTWRRRWQMFRIFVPLLFLLAIFKLETLGLKMWDEGQMDFARFGLAALMMFAGAPLTVFLLLEIKLRLAQREQRRAFDLPQVLHVTDAGLSFFGPGRPVTRWSRVAAFWFQDIPGEPSFSRLTVEYFRERNRRVPVFRRYVLEKSVQQPQLISKLTLLRQEAGCKFWIHLNQPVPVCELPRLFMRGLFLQVGGLLALLHGVPLLAAVLLPRFHHVSNVPGLTWPPAQSREIGRFLAAHFSSQAELRHFMLLAGGLLAALGLGVLLWGALISRAKIIRLTPEGSANAGQQASSF